VWIVCKQKRSVDVRVIDERRDRRLGGGRYTGGQIAAEHDTDTQCAGGRDSPKSLTYATSLAQLQVDPVDHTGKFGDIRSRFHILVREHGNGSCLGN